MQSGASNRRIAAQYSLTENAIRRHRAEHIPELLLKAREAQDIADAEDLLADIARLRESAFDLLDKAERSHEWRAQVAAIRECRENIRILAELQGKLAAQGTVNLIVQPEWLEVRTLIVHALEPHEDALSDVLRALEGAGNGRHVEH